MLWTGNSSEHPKTRDQQKHDNYRNIGVRAIFCQGGGGGAVNHLPKKFLQVAQIFTKQSNRNEAHTMQQHMPH